ncbi:MAG TPA: AMP-binding protein [Terriglobia bacterium]|nr:AMP-binding protein [Terriglobia bacterium]
MQRRSLVEYIDGFHRRGAETAFVHRRGYRVARWSYREISETAGRFARELEGRGIAKGDHVLIWGENCAEWIIAFFGCVLRGAVAVPLDSIAAPDFALRVSRQVDAKLAACGREVDRAALAMPVLIFDTLRESLARHSDAPYPAPNLERRDTLEIVFTSGTTSDPRGVVISHGNVLANLEPLENEIKKYLKAERFFHLLRFLNLVPLSHVFGQFMGMFVPPLLGGTVIFHDQLNPAEIVRTIKDERVSVLVAVPRLIEALKEKIERDFDLAGRLEDFRRGLQSSEGRHFIRRWWRFRRVHRQFGWKFLAIISGGAALDSEMEVFWRQLGFAVIQGYGMTETASLVSVNHPFRLSKGSIGKLIPGVEMKLSADGELLVRGENIASRYWQGKDLQPAAGGAGSNDGWFHTGDLGELDAQGNLYFKGRKKDVIVTAEGMKVYPADLEAALRRQPEIRDCVVVGAARGGNAEPCAVLVLRDRSGDAELAVQRANNLLAGFQRIRRWLVWPDDDFPRTSTQKPRAQLILQFVQAQLGEPGASRAQAPESAGTIAGLIGGITGKKTTRLPDGANLATDLNLSSIDRVELLSALEDRFQVEIDEADFGAASTVGDLEKMLRHPPASEPKYHYPRWTQRWPVTWVRMAVYYLLSWPATFLLGYPRVVGRENLRGVRGPLLIVSNHITYLDIGFILAALPARLRHHVAVAMLGERLRAMRHPPATDGVFSRWLDRLDYALVVALFNVFPLPQQTGFRSSFTFAGESADRGYSVVVFPEGRRTMTGKMSPFRAGIGLLAKRLDLPVVPIRIDGLFELKRAGKRMARPGAVTVTIGRPIQIDREAGPESIARDLEFKVKSLSGPGA